MKKIGVLYMVVEKLEIKSRLTESVGGILNPEKS